MSVLITFIKLIAVFDLLVIAVYFGGDILSTMLNKLRRKPKQEDFFDFSQNAMTVCGTAGLCAGTDRPSDGRCGFRQHHYPEAGGTEQPL